MVILHISLFIIKLKLDQNQEKWKEKVKKLIYPDAYIKKAYIKDG